MISNRQHLARSADKKRGVANVIKGQGGIRRSQLDDNLVKSRRPSDGLAAVVAPAALESDYLALPWLQFNGSLIDGLVFNKAFHASVKGFARRGDGRLNHDVFVGGNRLA